MCRWSGYSRSNGKGLCLEDNAVVDNLVNAEGEEVVVLEEGALVGLVPNSKTLDCYTNELRRVSD